MGIMLFLACIFVIEMPLRCCYGEQKDDHFLKCLVCDTLITFPIILTTLAAFFISSQPNLIFLRLARLIKFLLLLRAKDILVSLHRRAIRSTSLCYTLVLAMVATCMLVYLVALVLRVMSE